MTVDIRPDLTDADFIAAMPKVELHVHIEGTIEPETLFRIAERNGIELPYESPEGVLAYQASQKAEGRESLASRLEMHRTLLEAGSRISLNTDDPAQFGSGWITTTLLTAMQTAPFPRSDIVRFAQNAIDSAWIDDTPRRNLSAELESFCNP